MRELEILAPAKNLECGMAAIEHGADAVYIGASHHGARAAAGNSVEDIAKLCAYAHSFLARVYVTLNTLVYEGEMESVLALVRQLAEARVDALLVQDMGIVGRIANCADDDPLAYFKTRLHASTQTDNRTAEKVRWLHDVGFERVVLARETPLQTMRDIHSQNKGVELEAFVHGALCVSFSGLCYASQHCFKRSANRGECAQLCRMKYCLVDSKGHEIEHDRHLLSLKDMCQIENLEDMAEAGISSFKIEGRLKDIAYVKNVVAAYSEALDKIVAKHPDKYRRASIGTSHHSFVPDLTKTFNRGYTSYFLHSRQPNISSPDSPKAMGKYIGRVKEIRGNSFNVATVETLANGDGLCFINADRELVGFRANKVVGNRVYPFKMPKTLEAGVALYRNSDQTFDKVLASESAERKIEINMRLGATAAHITLEAVCKETNDTADLSFSPLAASVVLDNTFDAAKKPQKDNMVTQLSKLGNTAYVCHDVEVEREAEQLFIPSSMLATLRREAVDELDKAIADRALRRGENKNMNNGKNLNNGKTLNEGKSNIADVPSFYKDGYLYNIANKDAEAFYRAAGMKTVVPAFETTEPKDAKIMQCKYCIRYALGHCVKNGGTQPTWQEPLFLVLGDGRRFRLEFNCANCQMNIYAGKP